MELEYSLPCSQEIAPGSCPEPNRSVHISAPYFLNTDFHKVLPFIQKSPKLVSFLQVFRLNFIFISHISVRATFPTHVIIIRRFGDHHCIHFQGKVTAGTYSIGGLEGVDRISETVAIQLTSIRC
jgi:hypothetical protein